MKFVTHNLIKLSIFLFVISSVNLTQLRSDSEELSGTEIYLNGPSKNKFKGKVTFEKEGRGIVITSNNDRQNDKLLKLVSEKLSFDTYLIDYRLMRSCEFSVKFSGENNRNLKIGFSPRSLENKSRNEKFDIKLEILDYKTFFPKVQEKEDAVKEQIKHDCEARKKIVKELKNNILNKFNEYKINVEKERKILQKLTSTKKSTEGFDSSIADITSQIEAINSLQKSYEAQKTNIKILMRGSLKLLKKEKEDLKTIHNKNDEIHNLLKENTLKIKKMNEKENDLKKNYENYILEQKGIEGEIINLNKKISETDQQISSLARNKLSDEYEIQYSKSTQKEIKNLIDEIKSQTEKFKKSKEASLKKSIQITKSKDALEKGIKKNKEKIRNIDEQINELIIKKTKIEEEVKEQYNTIKAKEDELSAIDIENQQISSNIKRLEEKLKSNKSNLENIQEKHNYLSEHQKRFKNKLVNLNSTRNNITLRFKKLEKKKKEIIQKIKANDILLEKNSNETSNYTNIKFDLEKKIADNGIELNEKDSNVKNLEGEIRNYEIDIENIDKTISSFKENKQNIKKILRELNKKLSPYTQEKDQLSKQKHNTDDEINKERRQIKLALNNLKKQVPATKMIVDIIEDELNNSDEDLDHKKVTKLVEKIIS